MADQANFDRDAMQYVPQLYSVATKVTRNAADIIEVLKSLPENFRLPVLYADIEGYSKKEIAENLDAPFGTVMSRLHREEMRFR